MEVALACELLFDTRPRLLFSNWFEQWIQVFATRNESVSSLPFLFALLNAFIPEVVLCALLSKFTFKKCPNKEIIWNLSGIRFPSVAGQDSYKASLPLMVGLYKPTA